MLSTGKAVKVSIYLSEGATIHGQSTYSGILDFLFYRGVSGATVIKGIAGFGADHHMHSAGSVEISDHLPLRIEFIESPEKVHAILGKLEDLTGTGMIEMEETLVVKPAQATQPAQVPSSQHHGIDGKARMMQIYINDGDQWAGQSLQQMLVEAMQAHDLAGLTVYHGFAGYGPGSPGQHRVHVSNHHLVMLSVIDSGEKLQSFLPIVERMVGEGMVVLCDLDVVRYSRAGADGRDSARTLADAGSSPSEINSNGSTQLCNE